MPIPYRFSFYFSKMIILKLGNFSLSVSQQVLRKIFAEGVKFPKFRQTKVTQLQNYHFWKVPGLPSGSERCRNLIPARVWVWEPASPTTTLFPARLSDAFIDHNFIITKFEIKKRILLYIKIRKMGKIYLKT